MSILHDQQPPTQKSEQSTSGEVSNVLDMRGQLGKRGVYGAVETDGYAPARLLYLPNYESLRASIEYVSEVELGEIDARLAELVDEISGIEEELASQRLRLELAEECIDDLGLSGNMNISTRPFNGQSCTDSTRIICALEEAKGELHRSYQELKSERVIVLVKIEMIEQKYFDLLQAEK